jgi:hypothetical protein
LRGARADFSPVNLANSCVIAGADAFSTQTDGKSVAAATPVLDEMCEQLGVTPFTHFIPDFDELADLAVEDPDRAALIETSFDSADGLRTVSRLIKALQADKKWVKRLPGKSAKAVVGGLQLLEQDLKAAKKKKARFYLDYF